MKGPQSRREVSRTYPVSAINAIKNNQQSPPYDECIQCMSIASSFGYCLHTQTHRSPQSIDLHALYLHKS